LQQQWLVFPYLLLPFLVVNLSCHVVSLDVSVTCYVGCRHRQRRQHIVGMVRTASVVIVGMVRTVGVMEMCKPYSASIPL
jgi:hypothetical protein